MRRYISLEEVVWYIGIRLDKSWWTCKYNNPLAWETMSKNSIKPRKKVTAVIILLVAKRFSAPSI